MFLPKLIALAVLITTGLFQGSSAKEFSLTPTGMKAGSGDKITFGKP